MNTTQTPVDDPDVALVRRAAGGDAAAFARLLETHYDRMFRLAWRLCGNRADAEDVVQDVCVKLAGVLDGFDGRARVSTWLYRIVVNAARDAHRRAARQPVSRDPDEIVEALASADGATDPARARWCTEAWRLVDALPEPLRETVMLVAMEGLSHREAAQALGCAETTVSWRMFRVRRRLRDSGGPAVEPEEKPDD